MTSTTARQRAVAVLTTLGLAAGLTGTLSSALSGAPVGPPAARADTLLATTHTTPDAGGDPQQLGKSRQPKPDITQVTYAQSGPGLLRVTIHVAGMRKTRPNRLREEYSAPILIDGDHLYTLTHTRTWQPVLMHLGTGNTSNPAGTTARRNARKGTVTFTVPATALANTDDVAVGATAVLRRGIKGPWLSADYANPADEIALY